MRVSVTKIRAGFSAKPLFHDFNLDISGASPVIILGPSGCGKTTLLRLVAGLLKPNSGVITAPCASIMFQEPRLFPHLTVLENVMLPVEPRLGKALGYERALHYLHAAKLGDRVNALPHELSGGEQQRASMARAFTYDAPLLLLDEPFQSLDIPLRISLMETLLDLLNTDGRFLLLVTHDPREALYLGKRIIVLGKHETGVKIVLDEPVDTTVRCYLSKENIDQEARLIAALAANLTN